MNAAPDCAIWPGHEDLRLAVARCECASPKCRTMILLGSEAAEDRWMAFGVTDSPEPVDELAGDVAGTSMGTYDPADIVPRAAACYGMPWGEMEDRHRQAQLRILEGAPEWFAHTLLVFKPVELRRLRQNVEGDARSVTHALRALYLYVRMSMGEGPVP